MIRWIAILLLTGVLAALAAFWFVCPCQRIPGGPVKGLPAERPVTDWSFANEPGLCQLQVDVGMPWSVNLNCMSDAGALYVSCAACEGKTWSEAALDNPTGFIKIGGHVYPVTLRRVTDQRVLDVAWQARAGKLGLPFDTPRPPTWWSFRLESRT